MAFVFAAGCWIRFKIASGELLWLDELHTSWAVGGSFQQMLTRSAQGNQAPLFFSLEWLVVQWFGASELNLRLVSLVAGALAMLLAARFVWWHTRSIAASAVTLTLIAFDDTFILYSTEARPYALLHLTSLIQVACFWRLVESWRRVDFIKSSDHDRFGIVWLALSSLLVVYTHYTGVFLLATEFLFLLVLLIYWRLTHGIANNIVKQILVTLGLFVVGCLPLILQMNQAFGKPADWSSVTSLQEFLAVQKINSIGWLGLPLVAVLISVCIAAFFNRESSKASQTNRWQLIRWLVWIVIWFATPLLTIVMLHWKADIPIALSRYLSVALIAGPIFAGGVIGICNLPGRWIALSIVLVGSIFLNLRNESLIVEIAKYRQVPLLRHANWRSAISVVNDSPARSKWPLFLFGAVIEDENALGDLDPKFQAYLQFPVRGLYELNSSQRVVFAGPTMSRQHFDERYLDEVVEQGGAWVLVRHQPAITHEIANQLESLLQRRFENSNATIETNWFGNRGNNVRLVSIEIKPINQ